MKRLIRASADTGFKYGDRVVFYDRNGDGGPGTIQNRLNTKTGGIHTGNRNTMSGPNSRDVIEYNVVFDSGKELKLTSESNMQRLNYDSDYNGYTIEVSENGDVAIGTNNSAKPSYRSLSADSIDDLKNWIDEL